MKKTPLFLFLLFFCVQILQASTLSTDSVAIQPNRAARIRQALVNREQRQVLVASHRGDWRNFPENSLPAIDHAIAMGVDIVEVDVQRTKDGVLILMHDPSLNRTTTGKGVISEKTYAEIQQLFLKNGAAVRTKERVPTLEEALVHIKGKIMVNLDKADRYFDQVYDLLEKTGTTEQVIMKGNKPMEEVKALYGPYLSKVLYMPIVDLDQPDALNQIKLFIDQLHPFGFELVFKESSNKLPLSIPSVMDGKSLIWYNTLWDTLIGGYDDDYALQDPDKGYGYVIDTLGARLIQTDRPAYLIEYLKKRNLHSF